MNSENNQTSDPHRLLLSLTDKITEREMINMLFYQTLAFTTPGNIKRSYKDNKFKISAPTLNGEFELLDGSYSVPDIQDYFEYIF